MVIHKVSARFALAPAATVDGAHRLEPSGRWLPMRWRAHLSAVVLLAAIVLAVPVAESPPAHASSGISQRLGRVASGFGSPGNAQAFWIHPPSFHKALYLGRSNLRPGSPRWSAGDGEPTQ